MQYRNYNPEKDKDAVHRIWQEVGWVEGDNYRGMDALLESMRTIVSDVDGSPECLVISGFGDYNYNGELLKFSGIGGVTTGMIARRLKLALRLTAVKIAQDALEGTEITGLGIFDQGYYDKLGFGTGPYVHITRFSPSSLNVDIIPGVPKRLDEKDIKKMHASRLARKRVHGNINFFDESASLVEMISSSKGFGFGYFDEKGDITHQVWMEGLGKERGPIDICWMNYQNYDQFLELLALIKSLGDQIHLVKLLEPAQFQIQDFIDRPFRHRIVTKGSEYENFTSSTGFYQWRICDLKKCLEKTHLQGSTVRFNLVLDDPIEKYLEEDIGWKGISGNYIVTLGVKSSAEDGFDDELPIMKASVGAFTRMWLGVLPASSLACSDKLEAPADLLKQLDNLIRLPAPEPDWDF